MIYNGTTPTTGWQLRCSVAGTALPATLTPSNVTAVTQAPMMLVR